MRRRNESLCLKNIKNLVMCVNRDEIFATIRVYRYKT